jgi:hypothetical protein
MIGPHPPLPFKPPSPAFFLGLDLGQAQDFSALVALARHQIEGERAGTYHHVARGIRRWPLGTLYTQIVKDVVELVSKPPLAGCVLGVDRTGVGAAVVDCLKDAKPKLLAKLKPVLITAGHEVTLAGGGYHVPKKELVATLQVLLQSRRLEIPSTLDLAETLAKELEAFKAKITVARNEVFEAASDWRLRPHDDIVLALAIAAFLGQRVGPVGLGKWDSTVLARV